MNDQAAYHAQMIHPLCGKTVDVKTHTGFEISGKVERVVNARFGVLVKLNTSEDWWSIKDCKESGGE